VSAVEGQFYRRFKTARHPHTNMAKAALNMMTRTSAVDYHRTAST
jgi:NAD(P)-dependent dehydrogenase (short-subunit alcohol dehydrogenase family)